MYLGAVWVISCCLIERVADPLVRRHGSIILVYLKVVSFGL